MDWREIPSLSSLRAFEAAARLGSFSGAARELNVTHAAIAQHVRALEDHFNLPLMERSGRAMAVTPDGQALSLSLAESFGIIGTAVRDILDRHKARPLRIALTPSFAANWLMPRIGAFWMEHPDIKLELIPGNDLVDLRTDGMDVAIRYGRGGWPGVESEPLVSAEHVAVGSPTRFKDMEGCMLSTLKGVTWLIDGVRSEERLWAQANNIDLDTEQTMMFETAALAREAAKAGLGVALLPAPIVEDEIAAGRLVELCATQVGGASYHILKRPGTVNPARDAFVRWLKKEVTRRR